MRGVMEAAVLIYFWRLGGACRWRWALCQGRKATSSSQPTGCTMQFESGQFVSWSLQISDLASLRRRLRLACASPSVPPHACELGISAPAPGAFEFPFPSSNNRQDHLIVSFLFLVLFFAEVGECVSAWSTLLCLWSVC